MADRDQIMTFKLDSEILLYNWPPCTLNHQYLRQISTNQHIGHAWTHNHAIDFKNTKVIDKANN